MKTLQTVEMPNGGFVAGTLVDTKEGLKPIEQIRVGDWVLSKPESGEGGQAYKRVTKTVSFDEKEVWTITFYEQDVWDAKEKESKLLDSEDMIRLVATPNHPFWVVGKGWTALRNVYTYDQILLENGKLANVSDVNLLFKSNLSDTLAFEQSDRLLNRGYLIDFVGDGSFEFFFPKELIYEPVHIGVDPVGLDYDNSETFFRTKVYNFEVEGFHTYYVGTKGVWVQNTHSSQTETLEAVNWTVKLKTECFHGTTPICMELGDSPIDKPHKTTIELIEVGDKVLSRCEITGEMAYKRVTKVFEHKCTRLAIISCHYSSWDFDFNPAIMTTEEHPFWVIGKGWTAVRDLVPGDEFLTYNSKKTTVKSISIDTDFEGFVYNLEVEDFHTYFADSAGIWVHNNSVSPASGTRMRECSM